MSSSLVFESTDRFYGQKLLDPTPFFERAAADTDTDSAALIEEVSSSLLSAFKISLQKGYHLHLNYRKIETRQPEPEKVEVLIEALGLALRRCRSEEGKTPFVMVRLIGAALKETCIQKICQLIEEKLIVAPDPLSLCLAIGRLPHRQFSIDSADALLIRCIWESHYFSGRETGGT